MTSVDYHPALQNIFDQNVSLSASSAFAGSSSLLNNILEASRHRNHSLLNVGETIRTSMTIGSTDSAADVGGANPQHLSKNNLLDEDNLTFAPWLTILIACVATLMSSMTIIGNTLVITAFIIDKNLRKYSNYFILNLSIADLLIGILIPPYAPFLLYKRNWRLGKAACTLWLVLDYVVGSASVLCIVVISLDRYVMRVIVLSLHNYNRVHSFFTHLFILI